MQDTQQDQVISRDISFWRDLMIILALATTALVLGSEILISFVTAVFLFVLLTAITDGIEYFGVPRWLAHVIALVTVLSSLTAVVFVLMDQAAAVCEAIPRGFVSQIGE